MIKNINIIFFVVLLCQGCFGQMMLKPDSSNYVILCTDELRPYPTQPMSSESEELDSSEVWITDSLLELSIELYNSMNEILDTQISYINGSKYVYQIIPYKSIDGDKMVHVNAMCEKKANWEKKYKMVSGGGECYFTTDLNISTRTPKKIVVNAWR